MKFSVKATFAAALLLAVTAPASATLMTVWSGDGNDTLVSSVATGSVTIITPNPVWGDVSDDAGLAAGTAEWISYANTGLGGIIAPNAASRDVGDETAHFQRTFTIGGGGIFNLWILADDTATVNLTGPGGTTPLFSAVPTQIDPCAPGGSGNPIGCVEADMGIFSTAGLALGSYTLDIYAFQTNADVFGTQYAVQYSVPEPGTLGLLGLGLAGLGFAGRRRR